MCDQSFTIITILFDPNKTKICNIKQRNKINDLFKNYKSFKIQIIKHKNNI